MANDFTRHKENQSFQKKRTIQASCRVGPLVESCCFFFFLVWSYLFIVLSCVPISSAPQHHTKSYLGLVLSCVPLSTPPTQILPWSRTVLRTPLPLPYPKSYLGLVLSYAPLSPSPPPLSPQSYLGLVLSCVSLRSVAFSR